MQFSNSCLFLYLEPLTSPWSDFEARPPFPTWPHTKSNWVHRETPWQTSAKQGCLDGREGRHDSSFQHICWDKYAPCDATHHQHMITSFKVRYWSSLWCSKGRRKPLILGAWIWYFRSLVIYDVREGGGREPPRAGSALLTARLARNFSLNTVQRNKRINTNSTSIYR